MAREPRLEIIEHDNGDAYSGPSLARMPTEGGQLISEKTLFGEVVMAQPTRAPRDEAKIMKRIDVMAAAAGDKWFYRFPVKKRGGGVDYIEGPSIDCADAVSRYYGNCRVDCAVVDTGPAWIIYGRFIDLETGYTLIRPFLQSKAGSKLGGTDDERRLQIAMAIGTSKAQRNVIDHALRDFTDRAFEQAKDNLVKRVGAKLGDYRERILAKLNGIGPDMLARVERVYARKAPDWLAADVARIIGELRSITEGMATVDETWPPPPPAEPKPDDFEADEQTGKVGDAAAVAKAQDSKVAEATGAAKTKGAKAEAKPQQQQNKTSDAPGINDDPMAGERAVYLADQAERKPNYRVVVDGKGAERDAAVVKGIEDLISTAADVATVAAIVSANADQVAKMPIPKRNAVSKAADARENELTTGDK